MASDGSLPSSIGTYTDGEGYISAQEEVESVSGTQIDVMDENSGGNETRGIDAEESDSELDINELTVFIPKLPQPQLPDFPRSQSVRPTSKSKQNIRILLMEHEKSQIRKILCGVVILLIMFGIAALMIFLALLFNVDDLFIIGGIFIFGGSLFTIGFIIVRCSMVHPYDKADIEAARDDNSGMQSPIRKDASTPTFDF